MSAVPARLKRSYLFRLSADVPRLLEQVAARHFCTPTQQLEKMIASAVEVIIRGQLPGEHERLFIDRVRTLAASTNHPRPQIQTSYTCGEIYVEGIRQLQNGLQLPRNGLVVEYLVRAAWATEPPDDGGGDELARRRRAASRNLQVRHFAPAPAALTAPPTTSRQLSLLKEDNSE